MPQISIIKKADVQEARRFDAEFFKPEYLQGDNLLEKKGFYNLEKIASIKGGKRLPLEESFSNKGVPYIRAEDVKNGFVEYENVPKISEELHKKLINYQTKENDVLLTIVGNSVGDVGIVKFNLEKCNLTENATRITNLKEINPETLFVYLSSKYGQNQIHREKVGTAQPKLALIRIRNFKIPILSQIFQLQIEKIVKSAYEKQTQSRQLYKKAEETLLKELDLLDYEPEHILSFKTTKKEIDKAKRFDAEYFQPKHEEIIKKIEKYKNGWDYVKNIVDRKKGIEVGSETYQRDGMSFGRVSDFSIKGIEKTGKKISKELYQELKKDYQPKRDDILFTKDGTIGLSYVVKKEFEVILSGAFLRLSLKDKYQIFEKECLSLIFNSVVCKMQVEKLSGGAIIAHLKPSDFEKFKIPLIKPKIQKQIAEKIQKSHKLRKESKDLLEKAKTKVEQEIENKSGK